MGPERSGGPEFKSGIGCGVTIASRAQNGMLTFGNGSRDYTENKVCRRDMRVPEVLPFPGVGYRISRDSFGLLDSLLDEFRLDSTPEIGIARQTHEALLIYFGEKTPMEIIEPKRCRHSIISNVPGNGTGVTPSTTTTAPRASQFPETSPARAYCSRSDPYGGSAKTRSNGLHRLRPSAAASFDFNSTQFPMQARSMFFLIIRRELDCVSTNVAHSAPRDSASIPIEPVPANKSRTRAPSTALPNRPCVRISNMLLRKGADVGRNPCSESPPPTGTSLSPFSRPAIIRIVGFGRKSGLIRGYPLLSNIFRFVDGSETRAGSNDLSISNSLLPTI